MHLGSNFQKATVVQRQCGQKSMHCEEELILKVNKQVTYDPSKSKIGGFQMFAEIVEKLFGSMSSFSAV